MTLINVDNFMRRLGARENLLLTSTPLVDMINLTMPKGTLLHYVPLSPDDRGFRADSLLAVHWPTRIRVNLITEGLYPNGRTQNIQFNAMKYTKEYFKRQPGLKRSRNLERDIMDERDMVVLDYTLIPRMVRYAHSVDVYQNFWANMAETVIQQINRVNGRRPQFIQIPIGGHWMTEAEFKVNLEGISVSHRERLRDPALQWVLEIYRMLKGAPSLIEKITSEDVYFIFTVDTKSVFLPLSVLYTFADTDALAGAKFHDLLEKLLMTRTVSDEEAGAISKEADTEDASDEAVSKLMPPALQQQLGEMVEVGLLTAAQQKRYANAIVAMAEIPSPDGKTTLAEFATVTPEDTVIDPDINVPIDTPIVPEKALKSTVANMKSKYVREVMDKDIANVFLSLNRGGVILRDYNVTKTADALEETQTLEITLLPVVGRETTFKIELPVFNEDGTFMVGGIRYSIDNQKTDIPIRKTKSNQAGITSYAGKIFINRSGLAKNDSDRWLRKVIRETAMSTADERVTSLRYGTNAVPNVLLPRDYTALMVDYSGFKSGDLTFDFVYSGRIERYGKEVVSRLEKKGSVICGTYKGEPMVMDVNGFITGKDLPGLDILGTLGGSWGKRPGDIAVFKSGRREVPVIYFIAYHLGLDKTLRKLKVPHRWETLDKRLSPGLNEIAVNFADERIYITVSDPLQAILWNGLADMEDMTRRLNSAEFNRKDGWMASLSHYGANKWHTDNWTLMNDLFLDPITLEVLRDMKEPENLIDLFIRAADLVKTNDAPRESDPKYMRIRGLERVSGLIYLAMYEAIAEQRRKPNARNEPITIAPTEILRRLNEDASVQLVSEINPIHALKEQEAVTLSGTGGRTARTLVKRNRVFDQNDLGILSESTPDSAKVGIRGFLTPNAKVQSLRGMYGEYDPDDGSSSLLSTTALTLPDMDRDDGKRAALGAIQQSAVVPTVGSEPMPYRTGYDAVIASRLSDFFVFRAKQDGEVVKVTDNVIQVKYEDGSKEGYRLGTKHGVVAGELIPHNYVTDKVKGSRFKIGYVLAWNSGFFTRDFFNPENVIMLSGVPAVVALKEGNDTLEDGSAISDAFRRKLMTSVSKNKGIMVDFDQEIEGLVSVGDVVEFDTKLVTIKEAGTLGLEKTDAALLALSKLSSQSPKAKVGGKVSRIEVFYMGDPSEMSPSLKALVEADNARREKEVKDLNRSTAGKTGLVRKPTFISGEKLVPGKVIISIYIDMELESGIGDKSVVANQLKTVHGRTLEGINRTEDGRDIDLIFGAQSVNNRIVLSCIIQGVMNMTVRKKNQLLAEAYLAAGE